MLMIQEALQAKPVATVATLREATRLTTPTINSLLRELESRGIVKESTERARDRVYVYRRYLEGLAAEEEAPGKSRRGIRRVKRSGRAGSNSLNVFHTEATRGSRSTRPIHGCA